MQNEIEQIEQEVSPVIKEAALITVTNGINYSSAAEFLKELKAAQNKVTTFFAKMKKKAYDSWKQVVADENNLLDPLKEAETSVKAKMLAYDEDEKRRAREEELRLQRIADAKAEIDRLRQIRAASKLKTESLRKERLAQAEERAAPIIHVQHDTPKVAGISTRVAWKAEIANKSDFVLAATKDLNLLGFITIDQSALNRVAEATKGQLNYPGIKFYSVPRMAAAARK